VAAAVTQNADDTGESYIPTKTISMLPDDVLLEIFDFCQKDEDGIWYRESVVWKWHLLVQVCQRWRQIVFASPLHLNLQILCTSKTPVRKSLGIWPGFPIAIDYRFFGSGVTPDNEDNLVAALEEHDRVCFIRLDVTGSQLEQIVATVMEHPFPVLANLSIFSRYGDVPVLLGGFLGGSTQRLQTITLIGVPFPALPTLLLSAIDLVDLILRNIPPTGYILPETMAECLAALPRLKVVIIQFQSATFYPDQTSPPPKTRAVLSALASFEFWGASDYLEDLVGRIDSPQLNGFFIVTMNQLRNAHVMQLSRFIDRSVGRYLTLFKHADVSFYEQVIFDVYRYENYPTGNSSWRFAKTIIRCEWPNQSLQFSHVMRTFRQFAATLNNVVHLKLDGSFMYGNQISDPDNIEWHLLLHQFSAVQTLHVSYGLAGCVALVLEDTTEESEMATVLPSLDLVYLAGLPASYLEQFAGVRRLSGRSVTVVNTEMEFNERIKAYVNEEENDR